MASRYERRCSERVKEHWEKNLGHADALTLRKLMNGMRRKAVEEEGFWTRDRKMVVREGCVAFRSAGEHWVGRKEKGRGVGSGEGDGEASSISRAASKAQCSLGRVEGCRGAAA
jgi:hypothetical protein